MLAEGFGMGKLIIFRIQCMYYRQLNAMTINNYMENGNEICLHLHPLQRILEYLSFNTIIIIII